MKRLLLATFVLLISAVSFAQTMQGNLSVNPYVAEAKVLADWTGVNAIVAGTCFNSSGNMGTTGWGVNYARGTICVVDTTDPLCALNPYGSNYKCVKIVFDTTAGGLGFGDYIYTQATSPLNWTGNRFATLDPNLGVWLDEWYVTDSASLAYVNNTSGQVKTALIGRFGTGTNYSQLNCNDTCSAADGGRSFQMEGFGNSFSGSTTYRILDDGTTGTSVYQQTFGNILNGVRIKNHFYRDEKNLLGHVSAWTGGSQILNDVSAATLGQVSPQGPLAGAQFGVRFFAPCTNGCTNDTTFTLVLIINKVCNSNANSFCFTTP